MVGFFFSILARSLLSWHCWFSWKIDSISVHCRVLPLRLSWLSVVDEIFLFFSDENRWSSCLPLHFIAFHIPQTIPASSHILRITEKQRKLRQSAIYVPVKMIQLIYFYYKNESYAMKKKKDWLAGRLAATSNTLADKHENWETCAVQTHSADQDLTFFQLSCAD